MNASCIVLNGDFSYLCTVGWKRAINLVLSDKVKVLKYSDRVINCVERAFRIPAVVLLIRIGPHGLQAPCALQQEKRSGKGRLQVRLLRQRGQGPDSRSRASTIAGRKERFRKLRCMLQEVQRQKRCEDASGSLHDHEKAPVSTDDSRVHANETEILGGVRISVRTGDLLRFPALPVGWRAVNSSTPAAMETGDESGAELGENSHVRSVLAIGHRKCARPWVLSASVEGVPSSPDIRLEPGVDVHGDQSVEVTDHESGRDAEASTKGDTQMGEIAANPPAAIFRLHGRYRDIARTRSEITRLAIQSQMPLIWS